MHGRIKVRTSAEEAARKKKEQELKMKAYRAGMKKIFEKRNSQELDDEMMQLTGQILSRNPDVYTLWNIRKECLLEKQKELTDDIEKLQNLFDKDLIFTEQCLMVNPKSYSPWHHRCWIMENCPTPNWERELMLCTKYLKLDERNFHCWDYRRFVVEKSNVPPEKELEFCTEKIHNNFSNYSSWHYRSKLLPILYPHESNKLIPINEDKLEKELEMVLTAAFTDPNDSSAWFYQRWLLGYSQPALDIVACRITSNFAVISFTKPINLKNYTLSANCDILENHHTDWKPVYKDDDCNTTWFLKDDFDMNLITDPLIVTCTPKRGSDDNNETNETFQIKLISKTSDNYYGLKCPKFEYEFGTGVIEVLKNQLDSCNELLEYEPDSKWTLLTAALLMRAIDRNEYHSKALEYLKKLEKIDYLRKGYYEDLASKWIIEKEIEEWINSIESLSSSSSLKISLSGKNLTTICYEQYLCIADEIDLSKNSLTNRILLKILAFQCCQSLDLTGNQITMSSNNLLIENANLLCDFEKLSIKF